MFATFKQFFSMAIVGPSGTGKSETVKELSKYVAINCYVFNCSNQMDNYTMTNFFKGLIQSGYWCCFDEFNRVDIYSLSMLAV